MNSQNLPDAERRVELHALSDPAKVIGLVEVIPEAGGCAVKSTVCNSEDETSQKFVRSHVGRVPIPLFSARVALASQAATIKAEVKSDM